MESTANLRAPCCECARQQLGLRCACLTAHYLWR